MSGVSKIPVVSDVVEVFTVALTNLLGKPSNEIGEMLADKFRYWRFKNQVKVMQDAESYMKKHKIKAGGIALKNLVPLLEGAAIEEEESLQKMYSRLLVSYLDSESQLKSSVYPHLLSQLSKSEIILLLFLFERIEDGEKSTLEHRGRIAPSILREKYSELLGKSYEEYVGNLIRLNLVAVDFYLGPNRLPRVKMKGEMAEPDVVQYRSYMITPLGIGLLKACRAKEISIELDI